MTRRPYLVVAALLLSTLAAVAAYRAAQTPAPAASMASMLPSGALLTIESPDFAALLQQWNASPEQKAWVASDNYSVFSNSRLFGRLNDARDEFEAAVRPRANASAALTPDFLNQVAGRQSIFAWYDIGNLEFLYITRIDATQAANIALLKDRASWTPRQAGGVTFYLRKSVAGSASSQAEDAQQSAQGKARTVAFAETGGLLMLATREDLIANALQLLHPAAGASDASLASESWFTEASASLPRPPSAPALRMVLNLSRLVPLPYFRTYWVQRNVTEMKQYRAAVSDLYLETGRFREERSLLLLSPEDSSAQADLGSLASLVPADGVVTASAASDPQIAVTAIEEKLLGGAALQALPAANAPDPSLDATPSGSSADLETRIDSPVVVDPAASHQPLVSALQAAGVDAVLSFASAQPPANAGGLWVPIHSAVLLHGTSAFNPQAMQAALQQSLRGNLTAAGLGIEFRSETVAGQSVYSLAGPKPLFFATRGSLCFLSDDRNLLLNVLQHSPAAGASPQPLTRLAAFDHGSQRGPYLRLTSLIDGTNQRPAAGAPGQPEFFSGNIRSLSDSFAALASERFSERRDGAALRQTVTYQWQTR